MKTASISRQVILDRIRKATGGGAPDVAGSYAELERRYVGAGKLGADERIALMIERLREYDAEVVEAAPESLAEAIREQLGASGRRRFVAPEGLPAEWMVNGFEWKVDHGLSTAEVEQAEGVVTDSFCGIADSGTIVLHHSTAEGRRIISLLPDWHLCVLRASQVVETLPEYFARCAEAPVLHPNDKDPSLGAPALHPNDKDPSLGAPALATYISGPSATADIEMTRIKGVHGPRFLHVVVVRDERR